MQNVYDLAHELSRSLKETDQYKDFMAVKKEVDCNPQVAAMVKDFTEKNMAVQAQALTGQQPDGDMMAKIQSMYAVVMQDPLAARYLQCEMAFSQVVADIYKILGETVNG